MSDGKNGPVRFSRATNIASQQTFIGVLTDNTNVPVAGATVRTETNLPNSNAGSLESIAGPHTNAYQDSSINHGLPIAEAPKLLRLLALENTNGASLFPAYDGVKKAMDERRYWDKEDRWF